MPTPQENEEATRAAVRAAAEEVGIRRTAEAFGVTRWVIRRVIRGLRVQAGTLALLREKLVHEGEDLLRHEPEHAAPVGEKCPCGADLLAGDHASGRCEACRRGAR